MKRVLVGFALLLGIVMLTSPTFAQPFSAVLGPGGAATWNGTATYFPANVTQVISKSGATLAPAARLRNEFVFWGMGFENALIIMQNDQDYTNIVLNPPSKLPYGDFRVEFFWTGDGSGTASFSLDW
ncbi:hypothetical protein KQI63_09500 [bacterium]|nr:hypothetical protein [bacterium]